ncbi:MAG: hypothetical protein M3321_12535 [Actinomycetota bacterium]|nr:hypothetical protein [Actinomycetota bacterium]
MDAKALGRAGLVGWRRHVGERTARAVSRHTRLSVEQVEAIVGAIFVALTVRRVVHMIKRAVREGRRP